MKKLTIFNAVLAAVIFFIVFQNDAMSLPAKQIKVREINPGVFLGKDPSGGINCRPDSNSVCYYTDRWIEIPDNTGPDPGGVLVLKAALFIPSENIGYGNVSISTGCVLIDPLYGWILHYQIFNLNNAIYFSDENSYLNWFNAIE
ncbi:hypothetical protein SDC9_154247 [bioreactor metagenome]|uniref:Uncharacterized protein n=1 Tax=bioreactor metagenome TaxID=1076179 RepID=A0A645EZR9_9ZZZZ